MANLFLKTICGESVVTKSNVNIDINSKAVVGFYFAGSWCTTSKSFTPQLKRFYELYSSRKQAVSFEIIFISFDRDDKEYCYSVSDMPWSSIAFEDKLTKDKIVRKFKVHNIPALVLVESHSGKVITMSGTEYVMNDPDGSRFPWYPRSLKEMLSNVELMSNNTRPVSYSDLEGCFRALYFSAHWCPPCRAFTPLLSETYQKIRKSGHDVVIIFVSSDRSESSFHQYYSSMPWLAVPYEEEQLRKDLTLSYDVQGIPSLILLDSQDNVLTRDGRMEINEDPDGLGFPWKTRYVEELIDELAPKLYEEPCLVLFTVEEDLEQVEDSLLPVAEDYYEKRCASDDRTLHFFYCVENELSQSVKDYIGLIEKGPIATILDIPNDKYYLMQAGAMWHTEIIQQFVNRFLAKELAWNTIKSSHS